MKKSDYRRFKIASVEGANDFASMHEVVTRRYGGMEDLALPDLVLIDGGLGQLASARAALQEVGRPELAVVGLAKAKGEKDERVYLPGRKNPIVLRANSPATHLLQRVRDEAHRFAVTFHRKLRGKTLVTSQLDQIIGIGSITRTKLLKQFGSLANLAASQRRGLAGSRLERARRSPTPPGIGLIAWPAHELAQITDWNFSSERPYATRHVRAAGSSDLEKVDRWPSIPPTARRHPQKPTSVRLEQTPAGVPQNGTQSSDHSEPCRVGGGNPPSPRGRVHAAGQRGALPPALRQQSHDVLHTVGGRHGRLRQSIRRDATGIPTRTS